VRSLGLRDETELSDGQFCTRRAYGFAHRQLIKGAHEAASSGWPATSTPARSAAELSSSRCRLCIVHCAQRQHPWVPRCMALIGMISIGHRPKGAIQAARYGNLFQSCAGEKSCKTFMRRWVWHVTPTGRISGLPIATKPVAPTPIPEVRRIRTHRSRPRHTDGRGPSTAIRRDRRGRRYAARYASRPTLGHDGLRSRSGDVETLQAIPVPKKTATWCG
jgi:hypothetical protein